MGELACIKGIDLRWCPIDFVFYDKTDYPLKYGGLTPLYYSGGKQQETFGGEKVFGVLTRYVDSANRCRIGCNYRSEDTFQVNPKEYEKAVIDGIKEMLDHKILKISKKTLPFDKSPTVWVTYQVKKTMVISSVDVKADPRPWEDKYLIWIEENNNANNIDR